LLTCSLTCKVGGGSAKMRLDLKEKKQKLQEAKEMP
jgi:hypothetical protein